jgi:hypothetical protein
VGVLEQPLKTTPIINHVSNKDKTILFITSLLVPPLFLSLLFVYLGFI